MLEPSVLLEIAKQVGPWGLTVVLLLYVYFERRGTRQQLKGHEDILANHFPHVEEYMKETRDTLVEINATLAKQTQRLEDIWGEVRKR